MIKYRLSHIKKTQITKDFDSLENAQAYKLLNNLSEEIQSYQVQIDELDEEDNALNVIRYRILYTKESFLNVEFSSESEALKYKTENNLSEEIESFEEEIPLPVPDFFEVVKNAIYFGNDLLVTFAAENVSMGITQAGKTKAVADYLADVTRYIQTGALYEVVNEVNRLLSEGLPSDLAPFIEIDRINSFKQKIVDYLA